MNDGRKNIIHHDDDILPREFPSSVWTSYQTFARSAKQRLQKGLYESKSSTVSHFADVSISLPLAPPIIKYKIGGGDGNFEKILQVPFVVDFEEQMSHTGCGFDCTVSVGALDVKNKHFNFHPWCIT